MTTDNGTTPTTEDDDIIEAVVFVRLRRVGPGSEGVTRADRERALARLAGSGVPMAVYAGEPYHVVPDETWVLDSEGVAVYTDPAQVGSARWGVTPQ